MTTARREQLVVHARHATRGVHIAARGHELTVDEAARYGGHDTGANPVEHLLAGLASASLVVLRLVGEDAVAEHATLRVSASLNVDRVMGADDGAAFESVRLEWEVPSEEHAERLREALPLLAARRPGQALVDAAAASSEVVSVRP
ncbi:OsmC family protein [Actinomadura sp. DC4]|uniref:OsmC family protein n=1 Tax=Actinomadura sp. DC4 TaxID=3055069 RepID=UPI0025AF64B8|nr:OsmC family protein [Actinomadura sp. DC4]MDN3358174.1 OsmC family protein [Actinomadura sp. DC4]